MVTEAEVTYQITVMMELFFVAISVLFTVVSAYIVGLYWFLRSTGLVLKATAFSFFTLTLVLIGVNGIGIFRHMPSLNLALQDIGTRHDLSPIGTMAIEPVAFDIFDATAIGVGALACLIYLALFYLTFLHRWHDQKS